MERWRVNQPTAEDIEEVNARFIEDGTSIMQPQPHTIIAVSQNVSREGGMRYIENRRMSKMTPVGDLSSSWRQRGNLLIEASITKKSNNQDMPGTSRLHS